MRSIVFPIFLFFLLPVSIYPQEKDILMTIDGRRISLEEFERLYKKNNNSGIAETQTIDEYLKLFINFKLKVIEAENLGVDTTASFKNELNGYTRQLAKPLLTDSASWEQMLLEGYERLKKDIHARHILIRLDEKASPEDSLKAYMRMTEIWKRALEGEDFATLAKAYSEDPSAKSNGGDLGWFGAFRMVYPFETAAWNTPPGRISLPVRSGFGYHIIEVSEVRQALPRLHVAHIFIRAPETMNPEEAANAKNKISSIYDRLQRGENFEKLAMEESEDKATGSKGGELPWFSAGEMIPVFEDAAFAVREIGQYSGPVQSFYGWHIIKLLGRKGLGSYAEERPELIKRMNNGDRAMLKQQAYSDRLKKDYHYKFFPENYRKIYAYVDSLIFTGNWNDSLSLYCKDEIFTIADKTFTISDFARYLAGQQKIIQPYNLNIFIDDQFKSFCESEILDHEQEMLLKKNPEFGYIVQEYHDGILLFNLTDKMVWSKAIEDSIGLKKYFKANKKKYSWGERVEAYVITAKNTDIIEQARTLTLKYGNKKNFSSGFLKSNICPDDTVACITLITGKYEKGDDKEVDKTNWVEGAGDNFTRGGLVGFVFIKRKISPEVKKMEEARGLITADYQAFLEEEWIKSLRNKYPVNVNFELLKKINR